MRLLICAGGTGGGVYPALAVLQSLESEYENARKDIDAAALSSRTFLPGVDVLWVGVEGGMEKDLIQRFSVPFTTIPAAGVHGVGWRRLPGNMVLLAKGYGRSRELLRRFRPEVLFFTGGFIAVPMAVAGKKVPSLLYVPDIEPGLALKTLAHFSSQIAVTVEDSRAFLPRRVQVTVTGYPTRPDLKKWSLDEARKALGLTRAANTADLGGSKGALDQSRLSRPTGSAAGVQIIHITRQLDWEEMAGSKNQLPGRLKVRSWQDRYRISYLQADGSALSAADLVLSSPEPPSWEVPCLAPASWCLIPMPAVPKPTLNSGRSRRSRYLRDEELWRLALQVLELMRDKERRQRMHRAMQGLAQPDAAKTISGLLRGLAGEPRPGKEING
jgi:UDP-N-acetylglucosamine--N-acetylmuramyl-(pentapeptide) pyrophosphoryl-undecaprenol N-acetylglucosamine transferase